MQQIEFVKSLRSLLEYHRNSGIDQYPKNEEVSRFLHSRAELPVGLGSAQIRKEPALERAADNGLRGSGKDFLQPGVTLADIAEEVACCRACNLAASRLSTRAGRGEGRVRLLIIGGWLTGAPGAALAEDVQFGIEEDLMLYRMLAAINIQAEQVFITNAVKCVVPESIQPLAENVRICLSYLHRQITLLAPDCICTMGMIATRALLDLPQPLSQLRGRFQSYRTDNGRQIPLMATYHPSFLLQNPEMKKAAWLDLQSIGRQLKTFS